MMRVNTKTMLLERQTTGFNGSSRTRKHHSEANIDKNYRSWWLVKDDGHNNGLITIGKNSGIYLPHALVGKRIRFRLEVLKDLESEG